MSSNVNTAVVVMRYLMRYRKSLLSCLSAAEAADQAVDSQEARLVAVCQVAVVPQEDGNLAKSYLWASIWPVIDKIMALIEVPLAKSAEDKIFFLTL